MRRGWSGRDLVILAVVAGLVTFWLTPSRAGQGTALLAIIAGFVAGGAVLVLLAVVQMNREERRLKRAREASEALQFDSATYPGRTTR